MVATLGQVTPMDGYNHDAMVRRMAVGRIGEEGGGYVNNNEDVAHRNPYCLSAE